MNEGASFEFADTVIGELRTVARSAALESVFCAAARVVLAAGVENPDTVGSRVHFTAS